MFRSHGSQPLVKLNGTQIAASAMSNLSSAIVETDLLSPSLCRLVFSDGDATVLDDLGVEIGDELEVHTSAVGESLTSSVFTGSVYALEYSADERGGFSVVVGYDAGFVLRQRRGTTSFNDVTDGDVVQQVCRDAGVDVGAVEASDVVHPYVAQLNETAWDFLARRAAANDCIVYVADGALQFRATPEASSAPRVGDRASRDPLQLAYGNNLSQLLVRSSAAGQVGEVEARGWDPVTKAAVTSVASAGTRAASNDVDASALGSDHGSRQLVIGWPSLATEPECAAVAASAAEASASALTYAEGRAVGDPRLCAGTAVSLGVTGRFDGRYTLSTARHVFDAEGYTTQFTISGEHDRTMFGLLTSAPTGRIAGVRPALVTNVEDPQKLGRVKVKFPWLTDDFESNWSRVTQLGAGQDRGIFWFPEVDDEVLVTFMDGDVSHPVVLGGLYNGVDTPPLEGFDDGADGAYDQRCLRTRSGHMIEFSEVSGEELIRIVTGDQAVEIVLDQAGPRLVVTTTGDIEISADGSTSISSGGDLTIETQGKFSVSAQGRAEIESSSGLKLSSAGQVEVSGAMVNLN